MAHVGLQVARPEVSRIAGDEGVVATGGLGRVDGDAGLRDQVLVGGGHLLGGAGGIESVFSVLAIHHQKSPPTINIFNQDPECDLDYCANEARDLKIDVAVKNNCGFGGTNGTLVFKRL